MIGTICFILALFVLYNAITSPDEKNRNSGSSMFFSGGPDSSHGHHSGGCDSFGDGGGGDCSGGDCSGGGGDGGGGGF
ncbi:MULTISPECIES: hypothetical protein [Bacillus]|nr:MULTISPECIES: hypothetical protein [Bacillus]KKB75173.1 hypothetical protein TH62_02915 [Bacillus sp. TH008]MDU0071618.1 hypothetical protein [Bacillus sp. IG6]MED8020036.1 hypothetical protein [Bacillus glycinifermentans]WKB77197.1 hypothetical protein QYM22_23150 [Bacillus glycinifermentans]SCA88357.1 hypothetical protein BGLY_4534 [Bacillus glycinifermentans]